MSKNKFELLIVKGRIKYFNESGKSNPTFQSVYLCSNVLDNQIEFVDPAHFDYDFFS